MVELVSGSSRYAFMTEWMDENSGITWKYQLIYFIDDGDIEMHDIKNKKLFLKKCKCDNVNLSTLHIGSKINIFSRQIKIIGYADKFTERNLDNALERTLGIIKPEAVKYFGKILNIIYDEKFNINQMKMIKLNKEEVKLFYNEYKSKSFYNNLINYMTSGPILVLELSKSNVILNWKKLIESELYELLKDRESFEFDGEINGFHGSIDIEHSKRELNLIFNEFIKKPIYIENDITLGLIKPHAIKNGVAGLMIDIIQDYYDIKALEMINLNKSKASEFFDVYKLTLNSREFKELIDEMSSGNSIVILIENRRNEKNIVESFRELCGPMDPELARILRPKTLRAKFGLSKITNAIHCTDLIEDNNIEANMFFTLNNI